MPVRIVLGSLAALTQQRAYGLGGDVVINVFLVAQLGRLLIPLHPSRDLSRSQTGCNATDPLRSFPVSAGVEFAPGA